MAEIDPEYWIAPKLKSGQSFLEPMQGAHIKTMGVIKPWAPPRSYGLVIRLTRDRCRSTRCIAGWTASITASSRRSKWTARCMRSPRGRAACCALPLPTIEKELRA